MAEYGLEETISRGPLRVFHVAMGVDEKHCHVHRFKISTCSLDGRRKQSRRSKDVLAIFCIMPAVLRSLILYGKLYSGCDWVAVIRIIEVTTL